MRRRAIDAAAAVQRMWPIYQEALSIADIAAQQGLSEVAFAVYELLEQTDGRDGSTARSGGAALDERLKETALAIERAMTAAQAIIDWQHKEDVQRLLRRDIKRDLRQLGGLSEEQLNELAASMVEIARRKLAE
jgi:hypothetical protein